MSRESSSQHTGVRPEEDEDGEEGTEHSSVAVDAPPRPRGTIQQEASIHHPPPPIEEGDATPYMYVPATSSPEDSSPVDWPSDGLEEEDDLISVPDRPLGLFDKDELSPETSTGDDEVLTSLDPLQLRVPLVYDLLSDHIVARWYELFFYLGIDREELDKELQKHPTDSYFSLLTFLKVWLDRKDPPATWQALVDVLRNYLLEGNLADEIEEKYCGAPPRKSEEEKRKLKELEEDISSHLDDDSLEFSRVIIKVAEGLGAQSYPELYHLISSLRCPDGSRLIELDSFRERRTPDGLLLPLMYTNLCSCRDVDVLVHLLQCLQRDDLLALIRKFVSKVSIGTPLPRVVFNASKHFVFKTILNPAIKHIDLGMVSALKHAVCVGMGIDDQPYLIQFLCWIDKPISIHFQVPVACMFQAQDCIADVECVRDFASNGIIRIELEINESYFQFDLLNPGDAAARWFKGNLVERRN